VRSRTKQNRALVNSRDITKWRQRTVKTNTRFHPPLSHFLSTTTEPNLKICEFRVQPAQSTVPVTRVVDGRPGLFPQLRLNSLVTAVPETAWSADHRGFWIVLPWGVNGFKQVSENHNFFFGSFPRSRPSCIPRMERPDRPHDRQRVYRHLVDVHQVSSDVYVLVSSCRRLELLRMSLWIKSRYPATHPPPIPRWADDRRATIS